MVVWMNGPVGDPFNGAIAGLGGTLAHRQHELLLAALSVVERIVGLVVLALGALLFMLRDRLGAQAKAQGHGVTPLAYGIVGAILVAAGAFYAVGAGG